MRERCLVALLCLLCLTGCHKAPELKQRTETTVDALSTPQVSTHDVEFYSAALQRRMTYRVLLPASYATHPERAYPVLLLLHGRNSTINEREWQANSNLTELLRDAEMIVVLPEGDDSYYTNAAGDPKQRYEDYITSDLLLDLSSFYRTLPGRESRGIGGISMGGWGALYLGMRHPDLFAFVASMSGPLDMSERPFAWWHPFNSRFLRTVFGTEGTAVRDRFDLYKLEKRRARDLRDVDFFLSCGTRESLLAPNRRMAAAMKESGLALDYREVEGAHQWGNWNQVLPVVISAAAKKLRRQPPAAMPAAAMDSPLTPARPNPKPRKPQWDTRHPPS